MHLKVIFSFIVIFCLISFSAANGASEEDDDVMETDNSLRELDDSSDADFDVREFLDVMVGKRKCKDANKSCKRKPIDDCCPGINVQLPYINQYYFQLEFFTSK